VIKLEAFYYDGAKSSRHLVTVEFHESGEVLIQGDAIHYRTAYSKIRISTRLGHTPRNVFLENGAKLETTNNDAIDQINRYFNQNNWASWLDRIEKNTVYVVLAVIFTILLIWAGITYIIPFSAKIAAHQVPETIARTIGQQTLQTLDDWIMKPSRLSLVQQQRLTAQFRQLQHKQTEKPIELIYRNSPSIGANAFALPGNQVIITDQLVNLAENEDQILAVLAHETGHVVQKHGLRNLFQNSVTALLLAITLGDLTSLSSIAATLPTVLLQSRYSRQFEQEADLYAVSLLRSQQRSPKALSQILTLLSAQQDSTSEFDYLSSHPALAKRLKLIQESETHYRKD
jgi:Zn-dependent protease with chaperone function